jgi:hypothetical protein
LIPSVVSLLPWEVTSSSSMVQARQDVFKASFSWPQDINSTDFALEMLQVYLENFSCWPNNISGTEGSMCTCCLEFLHFCA